MDGEGWRLHRVRVLVGSTITRIDWTADPKDPATWRALSAYVRRSRAPTWVYRSFDDLADVLQDVSAALSANDPAAVDVPLHLAHRLACEIWSQFARSDTGWPEWEDEAHLQKLDPSLADALAAVPAPGRPADVVISGLLTAIAPELGRSTASARDSASQLAGKLLRRIARLEGQSVAWNRLTLVWSVVVPLVASGSDATLTLADRVLALFEKGLPAGFRIEGAPDQLYGREWLWPVVLETQVADFKGLPFSSKAGRACWKAKDPRVRTDVLVGVAQLAAGRAGGGLMFPESLVKGLTALAERVSQPGLAFDEAQQVELDACQPLPGWLRPHLEPVMLATLGRDAPPAPRARRKTAAELEPEVRGLRGGALLWPLVQAILDDPTWVSWRSHPPTAAALMQAPKTYAGHVTVGIQQLAAAPDRFGVPASRHADVNRVLSGFALKRAQWMADPALDDGDLEALAALG
ncbi:MAG: hypothetical protein H6737_23485 [Alphaproteobacteria bacterium]|nr:hypothetical protein [Alphaproteobacteria bacterium]